MARSRGLSGSTLSLLSLLVATPHLARAQSSNFDSEYNSAKKTVNGGMIAVIVVCVIIGVCVIGSGFVFCCVMSRNRRRRARQAQEIKEANERAAVRRAAQGGEPVPPTEESVGLMNYQYGPADPRIYGLSEMDASRGIQEADSHQKPHQGAELP